MTLVALDDEQKEVLKDWLHYLIRKMELGNEFKNDDAYQGLKSIQEQLLHPKPVTIFMDAGNTIATPKLIYIDEESIFINCD